MRMLFAWNVKMSMPFRHSLRHSASISAPGTLQLSPWKVACNHIPRYESVWTGQDDTRCNCVMILCHDRKTPHKACSGRFQREQRLLQELHQSVFASFYPFLAFLIFPDLSWSFLFIRVVFLRLFFCRSLFLCFYFTKITYLHYAARCNTRSSQANAQSQPDLQKTNISKTNKTFKQTLLSR